MTQTSWVEREEHTEEWFNMAVIKFARSRGWKPSLFERMFLDGLDVEDMSKGHSDLLAYLVNGAIKYLNDSICVGAEFWGILSDKLVHTTDILEKQENEQTSKKKPNKG